MAWLSVTTCVVPRFRSKTMAPSSGSKLRNGPQSKQQERRASVNRPCCRSGPIMSPTGYLCEFDSSALSLLGEYCPALPWVSNNYHSPCVFAFLCAEPNIPSAGGIVC
jgi:hypothetical protein